MDSANFRHGRSGGGYERTDSAWRRETKLTHCFPAGAELCGKAARLSRKPCCRKEI